MSVANVRRRGMGSPEALLQAVCFKPWHHIDACPRSVRNEVIAISPN
jgi:hypothetical protein